MSLNRIYHPRARFDPFRLAKAYADVIRRAGGYPVSSESSGIDADATTPTFTPPELF